MKLSKYHLGCSLKSRCSPFATSTLRRLQVVRLSQLTVATAFVGLALLTASSVPVKAQSVPNCHNNSIQLPAAGHSVFRYLRGINFTLALELQLRYCDSTKSNFARVIYSGTERQMEPFLLYIERQAGTDGGEVSQVDRTPTLNGGDHADTRVLYSPNNKARACMELNRDDKVCTNWF